MEILESVRFSAVDVWDVKRIKNSIYNSNFPIVPFSTVLKEADTEWVDIEDDRMYPILGVHAYGEGVYINRIASGKELTMKKYQKSQVDCLFWCKVRTVRGQFGVVTAQYENSYGSSNMKYMKIDTKQIMPSFLELLFKKNPLTDYMDTFATGADGRHFNPSTFLKIEFPLPSIDIQNRLVTYYHKLISKAEDLEKEAVFMEDSIETYLFESLDIENLVLLSSESTNILKSTKLSKLLQWGVGRNVHSALPEDLFVSKKYPNVLLSSICDVNPSTSLKHLENIDVTFLPMKCISDIYGEIEIRKTGKAIDSNGYTKFIENDVLWAKITPCMQNGKCAVAKGLYNSYGYGSTEYHVFRGRENVVLPEYIHAFLRTKRLRKLAQQYFTGSSGQQRVSKDFFDTLTIPLLPIISDDVNELTQKVIVENIEVRKKQIKDMRFKAEQMRQQAYNDFKHAIYSK